MWERVSCFVHSLIRPCSGRVDPEIEALRHDIEALDDYLRIQNLRRLEEERFIRLQREVTK